VTSDGAFQDTQSQAARLRELVEEQCRVAVEAMRQGDYEKSIEAYKNALALDSDYLPALNNLAIVYEKQPVWRPLAVEAWNRVMDLSRQRKDEKHMNRAQRHLEELAG
jgi:tetratricopeptide (TPR) repeat protein